MKVIAALAFALTSIGIAVAADLPPEQAVLEALLRHLVAEAQQSSTVPAAICVTGYDPGQTALIRDRVKADVSIVGDRSACPKQSPGSKERRYVVVWLGAAVRVADDEYIARASIYRNPLDAWESLFTLNLKGGQWVITKTRLNWVS